ncbi:MAG: DUF655 domain-containing protein [Nanoarchaeota archaeon]|nr:DUF655 domain-containing protein [Nanoarchaeota archaeon]
MRPNRFNKAKEKPLVKDEYAVVLDVVLNDSNSFKNDELAQAIGVTTYSLLELVPKEGVILKNGERVYIGDGKRDEIQFIRKSLKIDDLTGSARNELVYILNDIISEKEEQFVQFFNLAGPISLRKHSLELVHGIGKKHLKDLLDERLNKPFESFEDVSTRCPFLAKPQEAIALRIIDELEGNDDFKFFTRRQ